MALHPRRSSSSETRAEGGESLDVFSGFDRFEDMFSNWPAFFAFRRPMAAARHWLTEPVVRVDEFHRDGSLVIKAELPGIDPEKDVDLTVSDGILHIDAHREEETTVEDSDYVRKEMTYGAYHRDLPLPAGVTEGDVTASYKDGILEILVPEPQTESVKKIPVSHN